MRVMSEVSEIYLIVPQETEIVCGLRMEGDVTENYDSLLLLCRLGQPLLQPGQLLLAHHPVVRHEPPLHPLQSQGPLHSELGHVVRIVFGQEVQRSLGVSYPYALYGGDIITIQHHYPATFSS